jgi:N-acetylmuramoyl-L-alanine amidase
MDHGLRSVLIPVLCACCFVAGCGDDAGKARSAARDFMHGIVSRIVQAGPLTLGCGIMSKKYDGDLRLREYPWLAGKRIFIDPGHGGLGRKDLFRIGPGGITEEEVNLRVALILASMLRDAGAEIKLARARDVDVPLKKRVDMAEEFNPDLLISVHHNGSVRRSDGINYPCVLAWGVDEVNPASFDFARMLLDRIHGIMDAKGTVLSDFAVFPETGTHILRETRYLCPGVIGEAGFFSDEAHARHLGERLYNREEAEAYFLAVAEYFKRGLPSATVKISAVVDNSGYQQNLIVDRSPGLYIFADSGASGVDVDAKSFRATLDGLPVKIVPVTKEIFRVEYGKRLYPGSHALRFSFTNARAQRSPVFLASFNVLVEKGDYARLVGEGTRLAASLRTAREGLFMLRAALSMGTTDPAADALLWKLARAYELLGDRSQAWYHYARLYYFYPDSPYRKKLSGRFLGHRYPVEFLGTKVKVEFDPGLEAVGK